MFIYKRHAIINCNYKIEKLIRDGLLGRMN